MSRDKSAAPGIAPRRQASTPRLVAAAVIGFQALGCAVLALLFPIVSAQRASLSSTSHLMFSVVTALFAVALGLVARGLWRGLSWPRTAAVVWLVLLVPVGWAMVQAGWALVGVLIVGSAVAGIVAVALEGRSRS